MPEYKRRFVFYESFYRAARHMSDEQELKFYRAMGALAFDGEEPDFDDPLLAATWETVGSALLAGIKSSEHGAKGGASKGASKGASNPGKGASKGASKQLNEKKLNVNKSEDDRDATLERMYSQSVKVVPIGKEAL